MANIAFGARTTRENNYVGVPRALGDTNLGPGAYNVPPTIQPARASSVAFGSNTERQFVPPKQTSGTTVGPGSYNPPVTLAASLARGRVRKGVMARSAKAEQPRAPPMSSVLGPGPGTYKLKDDWQSVDRVALRAAMDWNQANAQMEWVRLPSAPSIPTKLQGYGYEEGDHGELIQQKPSDRGYSGEKSDVPGPTHYDPKPITKHSGAISFKGAPRETIVPRSSQPDPPPPRPISPIIERAPPRRSAAFTAKRTEPRIKKGPERTPGPGDYGMQSSLKLTKPRPRELQHFGSTVNRFSQGPRAEDAVRAMPGPADKPSSLHTASYQTTRHEAIRQSKSAPGLSGFRSTTTRFNSPPSVSTDSVGPGKYQLAGFTEEVKRKSQNRPCTHFGSTSKRFQRFSSFETPGPGKYSESSSPTPSLSLGKGQKADPLQKKQRPRKGKVFGREIERPSAGFAPSERENFTKGSIAPPPGTYDTSQPWIKQNGTIRLDKSAERFPNKQPEVMVGPGDYSIQSTIQPARRNRKGVMVSSGSRFDPVKKDSIPGPGSYDSEMYYGNLLKPTYNIAIAEQSADLAR